MPTGARTGLTSARKLGSRPDNQALNAYTIASGYATTIGSGDPVKLVAGSLQRATNGDQVIGIFNSVHYTGQRGTFNYQKLWTASTIATDVEVLVMDDPDTTMRIKADGVVTQLKAGDILALSITDANVSTGRSNASVATKINKTGNVSFPLNTAMVGTVAGLANGNTFTVFTQDGTNTAQTITIATGTTGQQLLDSLNAVPGVTATRTTGGFLSLTSKTGYPLVLANTSGTPLTSFGITTGTTTNIVAANAGMFKVVSVVDYALNELEVTFVNHALRANS